MPINPRTKAQLPLSDNVIDLAARLLKAGSRIQTKLRAKIRAKNEKPTDSVIN